MAVTSSPDSGTITSQTATSQHHEPQEKDQNYPHQKTEENSEA
ncbi:hypothetical protein [Bacterioplanoides sp.]